MLPVLTVAFMLLLDTLQFTCMVEYLHGSGQYLSHKNDFLHSLLF